MGVLLSADKKKTMKVFAQFYEFNEQLILNMKYGRDKVNKLAEDFDYVKSAMQGKDVLKGDNGEFIRQYVRGVGTTDAQSQIDYLEERKLTLKKYKEQSEEDYKKYSSLYVKLSLMFGILVAVLLA